MRLTLALLLGSLGGGRSACTLVPCSDDTTCTAAASDAYECLTDVPFNQEWTNATLDVLTSSLENYGFKELMHDTGPPYNIKVDVMAELNGMYTTSYASDYEFQEATQVVLTSLLDAHTRYKKPNCYNMNLALPISVDYSIPDDSASYVPVVEQVATLALSTFSDQYAALFPTVDFTSTVGKQILTLNGVEATTAISTWGATHETRSNNPGARFNAALRSYFYRSTTSTNIMPFSDTLDITFTDGTSIDLPWMAMYGAGFGQVSACTAKPPLSSPSPPSQHQLLHDSPPQLLHPQTLAAARTDRTIIISADDPTTLSCFTQTLPKTKAGVKTVLVMKIASFSPPGYYTDAWTSFLGNAATCLGTEYDMIVVDVMQNGGGYVCMGWRMLELLVEDFNIDHEKVQMRYDMPQSALMDAFVATNDPTDPYINPQDVEQILDPETQKPYTSAEEWYGDPGDQSGGRIVTMGGVPSLRTNIFTLNCQEAEVLPTPDFAPRKFMSPDKLVILTDGTCGSTCASFTKIAQEAEKATFVGAGGLWDQVLDVSSFAGGFVCNPGYLQNIAAMSGVSFPKFITNQGWQFDWAVWYSKKFPSRPVQFTEQEPHHREKFWAFPHISVDNEVTTAAVSDLYDSVISDNVDRLVAAMPEVCSGDSWTRSALFWVGLSVLGMIGVVMAFFLRRMRVDEGMRGDEKGEPLLDAA